MDKVHRVIKKERPVFMAANEVEAELLDDVGVVLFVRRYDLLAVFFEAVLPLPTAGCRVGAVFVEAPVLGSLTDLPPLARFARCIARCFEQRSDGFLVLRFRSWATRSPGLIGEAAGAECVTARHQRTTRRSAKDRGVTSFKTYPRRGELIDVRGLVFVCAIAAHTVETEVISENEDDVRLCRREQGTWGEE